MSAPLHPARRRFIRQLAAGSAAVSGSVLLSACGGGGGGGSDEAGVAFRHGVASGDPLQDRVILWTRLTPAVEGSQTVVWEVARDAAFTQLVAQGSTSTSAAVDYTVKVDATGLSPDCVYFYRFQVGDSISPAGRTRTLPQGSVAEVRLAVFSCSNYPAGYFHVFREAAADDVHAALHLGDYIYEYGRGEYASDAAAAMGREVDPAGECLSLADYRTRYAQYRLDADLQAFHAALPLIAVWDDHEIANDTWKGGAENHNDGEGSFATRQAAALQAWAEWLPVRLPDARQPERIYRSFSFGDLLALHMLDTRVIARDKQLDYASYMGADGAFDTVGFGTDMADPGRQMLGETQQAWLEGALATSSATWQMLGQQVVMGRMALPAPVALRSIGFTDYAALAYKAQTAPETLTAAEAAILAQPSIPYNLDAWDGYAVARERVLGTARALDKNLVVLAGDTHNAWASDLADAEGVAVGVEFATSSVSSPGLEEYLPDEDPLAVAAGVVQIVEPLRYANTHQRGYLRVTVTPAACQAHWRFVSTVKSRTYTVIEGPTLVTAAGARVIAA